MQDFEPTDVVYVQAEVLLHRAYPFRVAARDLARFGLLYLSQGRWKGRQGIPDGWVELSSTSTERYGDFGGYEYLWWVEGDGHFPGADLGGGAFSARGAGGHYIVVVPRSPPMASAAGSSVPRCHPHSEEHPPTAIPTRSR